MNDLDKTAIRLKDLAEQPMTKYVVVFATDTRTAVGIDDWQVDDQEFRGLVEPGGGEASPAWAPRIVVAFPASTPWMVYKREIVTAMTKAEALRQAHVDMEAIEAFSKELDPDGKRKQQPQYVILSPEDIAALGGDDARAAAAAVPTPATGRHGWGNYL